MLKQMIPSMFRSFKLENENSRKIFVILKTKTAIAYLNTWEISGSISSNIDVANIIT